MARSFIWIRWKLYFFTFLAHNFLKKATDSISKANIFPKKCKHYYEIKCSNYSTSKHNIISMISVHFHFDRHRHTKYENHFINSIQNLRSKMQTIFKSSSLINCRRANLIWKRHINLDYVFCAWIPNECWVVVERNQIRNKIEWRRVIEIDIKSFLVCS